MRVPDFCFSGLSMLVGEPSPKKSSKALPGDLEAKNRQNLELLHFSVRRSVWRVSCSCRPRASAHLEASNRNQSPKETRRRGRFVFLEMPPKIEGFSGFFWSAPKICVPFGFPLPQKNEEPPLCLSRALGTAREASRQPKASLGTRSNAGKLPGSKPSLRESVATPVNSHRQGGGIMGFYP